MNTLTRVSPDRILELGDNEIFVFGSNIYGHHGAGAARIAHERFGAKYGIGEGKTGQTYAIPTILVVRRSVAPIDLIKESVDRFIVYAKGRPDLTFLVTEIGCGIAGYTPEEIAPLFAEAVKLDNIHLPSNFWNVLNNN